MALEIKDANYAELAAEEKLLVIDFWAEWCGPCRMLAPTVDAIATEREDIKVGKINVDVEQELCVKFGIDSIPTLIVLKSGEIAGKLIGYNSKTIVEGFIDKTI